MTDLSRQVMARIDALAKLTDEPGRLTRTFCSRAMREANDLVGSWMREAGMAVREDAIGNLIGRYEASARSGKMLLFGSHLDTVRDAGKFDGALGVLVAIACVERLHRQKTRLPFAIDVIGFCDEEGVRYQSTYLGSKALAGTFNLADLQRSDASGVSMTEAIRSFGGNPEAIALAKTDPESLLGYVEVHIEQGPLLEQKDLSIGVVTAIAAQTRMRFRFTGRAGHAGTVPMSLRQDALCAAAEFVLAAEKYARDHAGLVATAGEIHCRPGATNVIPGEVSLSLDVRHANDSVHELACQDLPRLAEGIGEKRRIHVTREVSHKAAAIACDPVLTELLRRAAEPYQRGVVSLASGAGHDAVALAAITPVAMLFVRCKDGISHHPDESVAAEDVGTAIEVMADFLALLAKSER